MTDISSVTFSEEPTYNLNDVKYYDKKKQNKLSASFMPAKTTEQKTKKCYEPTYEDINDFKHKLTQVASLPKRLVDNIPLSSLNKYEIVEYFRQQLNEIKDKNQKIVIFLNTLIDEYVSVRESCRGTCTEYFCSKSLNDCQQVNGMFNTFPNLQFANMCFNSASSCDKDEKRITRLHEKTFINCMRLKPMYDRIIGLTYVWLLDNKKSIDEGNNSKTLLHEYNQVVDLAQTYTYLFNEKDPVGIFYKKKMQKFPRINEEEIHKVPENSDLYCEQLDINDADPFTLKCSWKGESVQVDKDVKGGRRRKSVKRNRRKSKSKSNRKSKSIRRKASHSHKKRRH